MATSLMPLNQPWYTSRRFQIAAGVLLLLVTVLTGYVGVCRRENDFVYHRTWGEHFLAGSPYELNFQHYPLSRGMIDALTVALPHRLDRLLHFGGAALAMVLALGWWCKLAAVDGPLDRARTFAAVVFALLLSASYLFRDGTECGLQIWLLFFLSAAAWAMHGGRPILCGFWLGLSVAYKFTPVIFLPFLLWKRQWRAAVWMGLFAITFNLLPAVYLGWDTMIDCHRRWLHFAEVCMAAPDPSRTPVEPPHHVNQSLSVAIARFMQTYPPGDPLALRHRLFIQFGDLDLASAKRGVGLVLLGLGCLLAWRFRKPWQPVEEDRNLAAEWAAVTLLCALLSPLCWLQHLVLIVPALVLWMRAALAGATVPRWQWAAVGAIAAIVFLVHRDLMSAEFYEVMVSYKLHTLAGLLALALVLNLPKMRSGTVHSVETDGEDSYDLETASEDRQPVAVSLRFQEE
jgi:hypothetical protein